VCNDPELPGYDHPSCVDYRATPLTAYVTINALLAKWPDEVTPPELCGQDAELCLEPSRSVWEEVQGAAEAAYDRSDACTFTTFVGYEWSSNPSTYNLHRNIVFRNEHVPDLPASYFEATTPEALWSALRAQCLEGDEHCDALAIAHNSNMSNGLMFQEVQSDGSAFDTAYAAEREALEPLLEIFQHKGDSECQAGALTGDELCGFEEIPFATLAGPVLGIQTEAPPSDFARSALLRGLALSEELGANPFHYGFVASTDTHLGTPGAVDEIGYPGHGGAGSDNSEELPVGLVDVVELNPGGLAVLWAEENSREALFQAMQRREAYGTSGPRIVVRFFGGWEYPDGLCDAHDLAEQGYAGGVPMGGLLPESGAASSAPRFVVSALRDAGSDEASGTPLQRIQIVKGWLDGDAMQVEVHDVAGDPENGASVDLSTCAPSGSSGGFDALCAQWQDPSFDPAQPAFYYARVLENPTCRWATRQCNDADVDCDRPETMSPGFEGCCVETWERIIQERAWSSPIWYRPS